MRQPETANQTDPLAQGLCLAEGQHGFPHLTAVADRNVRHELHPSSHNSITLASSNETNSWRSNKAGENKQTENKSERKIKDELELRNMYILSFFCLAALIYVSYCNDKTHLILVSCCDPPHYFPLLCHKTSTYFFSDPMACCTDVLSATTVLVCFFYIKINFY